VALFYYAGHGLQVAGVNWLVPVDANIASATDVKYELVDAGFVLDEMTGVGDSLNLVILDACRNNPFATRGLRGIGGGLAQVTAPAGTIIGYATQPGAVAMDGEGMGSPYSSALAKAIVQPGIGVIDALNLVGLEVQRATNGRQEPWLALSPIDGHFAFVQRPRAELDTKPSDVAPPKEAARSPFAPIPRTTSVEAQAEPVTTPPPPAATSPPPSKFRPWIRDLQLRVIDVAR
jgi:Caspase domain